MPKTESPASVESLPSPKNSSVLREIACAYTLKTVFGCSANFGTATVSDVVAGSPGSGMVTLIFSLGVCTIFMYPPARQAPLGALITLAAPTASMSQLNLQFGVFA